MVSASWSPDKDFYVFQDLRWNCVHDLFEIRNMLPHIVNIWDVCGYVVIKNVICALTEWKRYKGFSFV